MITKNVRKNALLNYGAPLTHFVQILAGRNHWSTVAAFCDVAQAKAYTAGCGGQTRVINMNGKEV